MLDISEIDRKNFLRAQKNEITENYIYSTLSKITKKDANKKVLKKISDDELEHYNFFRKYTLVNVKINRLKAWWYILISSIFGITFGMKLMESGEINAQKTYEKTLKSVLESKRIMQDERSHEKALLSMIDEEKLNYVSSVVLGLNDALVEITSTIAGVSLALQDTKLVAATASIMGIAASLSMGASGYLEAKTEAGKKNPVTSLLYTGIAYIITVAFLVLPFILMDNVYAALILTILTAMVIILLFTFYVSIVKEVSFKKRFLEMASISLGIATFTFFLGYAVRLLFNIQI